MIVMYDATFFLPSTQWEKITQKVSFLAYLFECSRQKSILESAIQILLAVKNVVLNIPMSPF